MKDRFYEKLEHAFDKFHKYHTRILVGDFSAKVGREDIFKPQATCVSCEGKVVLVLKFKHYAMKVYGE
jgi:hypothetical protein